MSRNLNPFHAELLDFIERDVARKIAAEGFDETADSELKAFQKSLTDAGSLDFFPLTEIVESYERIFHSRGPLHLEKKLIESFSVKDAKEERIRMYRGLPRYYRQQRPADSYVKRNFTHLPTLKRLAAEKAIFRLYSEKSPESAKVSFFSWVIGDGWGDYIAGMESIEILKCRFPDLQLGWVVLFPKHLGSPPVPRGVKTHLIYYEKDYPISLITREPLEILRTSDLIFQINTIYPYFDDLRTILEAIPFSSPQPKWLSIGEYGFLESKWYHPKSGNRCMGIHFLEKGIIIKPPQHPNFTASFSEIENQELLYKLFNTSTPGPQEIEQYRKEHHFYLSYLTSPIGGMVYIHALIKAHEIDQKGIDLCCPDISWLDHLIEMQARAGQPILEAEGVGLELHLPSKVVQLVEKAKGKKIRIFAMPGISPTDFHLLTHLSGEWVAIRGNQSFSEVVSVNKGFFFDGRDHLRYFLKDLLALAENRIGAHRSTLEVLRGMGKAFLHNLPMGRGEWVEETNFQEREPWKEIALKIGAALQDPDCLAGFKKLNRIISEEHAFNDFLCHLVQREVCHRNEPKTALLEEESIRPFAEGSIPLSQALMNLKNMISYGR